MICRPTGGQLMTISDVARDHNYVCPLGRGRNRIGGRVNMQVAHLRNLHAFAFSSHANGLRIFRVHENPAPLLLTTRRRPAVFGNESSVPMTEVGHIADRQILANTGPWNSCFTVRQGRLPPLPHNAAWFALVRKCWTRTVMFRSLRCSAHFEDGARRQT